MAFYISKDSISIKDHHNVVEICFNSITNDEHETILEELGCNIIKQKLDKFSKNEILDYVKENFNVEDLVDTTLNWN